MIDLTKAQLTFEAWQDAVDRLAGKADVASALRTADWERVPLAIRERAFFSAGVDDARTLQTIRTALEKALQGRDDSVTRPDGTPMSYSRADAIADIRKAMGAEGDSGSLTDITSHRRQQLIMDFQIEQANSYGRYKRDLGNPNLLDALPAQELVRVSPRVKQRDWWTRWAEAGSQVGWEGASRARMVALKTSPIWAALSRFGTPFPPFDFGSGMGLEDVDYDTADGLGLIPKGWDAEAEGKKALRDFNKDTQASLRGLDEGTVDMLKDYLDGNGVDIKTQGESVWIDADTRKGAQPQRGMDRLAPTEQRAIRNYTEKGNADVLNSILRTGEKMSPAESEMAARLRGGLSGLPDYKGNLYRRVREFPGLEEYQPGKTITEAGFSSASVVPQESYGPIEIQIKSRRAKDIASRSLRPEEQELLFRDGTRFKVTDRRMIGDTLTIIMEELP